LNQILEANTIYSLYQAEAASKQGGGDAD